MTSNKDITSENVDSSSNEMLESALEAAEHGWKVFPLYGIVDGEDGSLVCECTEAACASPGKHPRVQWTKQATTEASKINWWWRMWPHSNLGIVTGDEFGVV